MPVSSTVKASTARRHRIALGRRHKNRSSCEDPDSAIDMEKLYRRLLNFTKDFMEVALVKSSGGGGDDCSLAATANIGRSLDCDTKVSAGTAKAKLPRPAAAIMQVISRRLKKSNASDPAKAITDGSSYNSMSSSSNVSNDKTSLIVSATKEKPHQVVRATSVDERLFGPDYAMRAISFESAALTVAATNSDPDSSKAVLEIRKANLKLRRMYKMSSLIDKDEYDNDEEDSCMVWGSIIPLCR